MSALAHTVDAATTTMISLVGSLADNKGALGRRYGEWAVSAPTIESAVAPAAMAQDELGHVRSTYPVLAKLGVHREDEDLESGHPVRVIGQELPDWASFIAANPVVDGDHAGYRDAIAEGMVSQGPAAIREQVRGWLSGVLSVHGAGMALDEPVDWSNWDEEHRR